MHHFDSTHEYNPITAILLAACHGVDNFFRAIAHLNLRCCCRILPQFVTNSNLKAGNGAPRRLPMHRLVSATFVDHRAAIRERPEDNIMPATKHQRSTAKRFVDDDERWQAVLRRDRRADGEFVLSVKTTGIYCRPSCPARRPRRENVRFYDTAADAQKAGFRPCKRCRPNAKSFNDEHAAAVSKACQLIHDSIQPPDMATLADAVGMSASHFRRVFKSATGVTPKAYAVAHRSKRTRQQLTKNGTVTEAIQRAGFKSNGRFYASSSAVLGMTPKRFQQGGNGAVIRFAIGQCSLGDILVAATDVGIALIALGDDPQTLLRELQDRFPNAELIAGDKKFEKLVATVVGFIERPSSGLDLPLDIQGTAFQQRVWQLLRKIPCGKTATYSQIAKRLGKPESVRAVASAIAANPIAVAIPCHRVIRTDGSLSGYRWGVERKAALQERERSGE
jgi:AraC family transcriptional regulator, regulatory protein of adaptative response / methylated-DNA-[protein]-cysteine methyltransferase